MTIEVPMWMVWMFAVTLWLLVILDLIRAYLNWRIYQLRKAGAMTYEDRVSSVLAHDFKQGSKESNGQS